jgi:hypothetical protein
MRTAAVITDEALPAVLLHSSHEFMEKVTSHMM